VCATKDNELSRAQADAAAAKHELTEKEETLLNEIAKNEKQLSHTRAHALHLLQVHLFMCV